MMLKRFAIVCCGAILLAGCGKENAASREWAPTLKNPAVKAVKVGAEKSVPEMADDDVVVAVNGIALTKKDVDERLEAFRWALSKYRMMRAQERDTRYKAYGRSLIGTFISTQLLLWDAREKCHLDEATIRTFVQSNLVLTAKSYRMKPEQLTSELPGGLLAINRAAEEKIWLDTYATNCLTPQVVLDQDVTNVLDEIKHENAAIAATNALRKVALAKIRASIQPDGGNFEDVQKKLDDDPNGDDNVSVGNEEIKPDGVQDKVVREALQKLEVGQVSDVLEDSECYFFVKMTDRRNSKEGEEICSLGKISISKEQPIVLANERGLKQDFEGQMLRKAMSERIEELKAKAQIVYPHGTNFWRSAKTNKAAKANSK